MVTDQLALALQADTTAAALVIHVIESMLAALVYSVLWYARSHAKHGEEFNGRKFAATLVVGGGVGLVLAVSGVAVTAVGLEERLLLYAGVISLVEAVLKTVFAEYRQRQRGQRVANRQRRQV